MSGEVISQSERCAPGTLTDSDLRAEEVGQRLKLLGEYPRLQLAATLCRVSDDVARRDPDEIVKRSNEVELTEAAT